MPKSLDDFKRLLARLQFTTPGGERWYYDAYLRGGDLFTLRVVSPEGECNVTGNPSPWKGRPWVLSTHMTDGEVVQTAFLATMTALEHEARENFKFDGVTVLDPHLDIHAMAEARRSGQIAVVERSAPVPPATPKVVGKYEGMA